MNPNMESARIIKAMRDSPTGVLSPEECIRKALTDFPEDATVSWSGGRCSTAVLYLAREIKPDVKVIFNDTGVEFPETYAFIKKISKAWNLNFEVLKPRRIFWDIVKEYGFPMLRGQYKDDSKSKDGRPMCCQFLKEEPILRARIGCCLTGIRVCESRMRMFAVAQRGQYYYAKTLKRWNFHPIAFWNTQDLLDFHKKNNIPQNAVYAKGQSRCGCWPCTGFIGWKKQLNSTNSRMYRLVARMKGEPTLWEYYDDESCQQGIVAE